MPYMIKVFMISNFLIFSSFAKDFGRLGEVFPISEEKFTDMIEKRLEEIDWMRKQIDLQTKVRDSILHPKNLGLLTKKENNKIYEVDVSYIVEENITDHVGSVIAHRGQKVNPFHYVSLDYDIVILDGSDARQIEWLKKAYKDNKAYKLILTGGSPIELSNQLDKQVYYDQDRVWIDKFKITSVPVILKQGNNKVLVHEIPL